MSKARYINEGKPQPAPVPKVAPYVLLPWVTPETARLVVEMDRSFYLNAERWPTHEVEIAK